VVEARAQSAHLNDPLIIASEQISLVTRTPSARSTLRERDLSISRVVLVRKRKRRVGPEVNKRWPRACTRIAVSRRVPRNIGSKVESYVASILFEHCDNLGSLYRPAFVVSAPRPRLP